ncbi:MAG: RNA-binding transcriptional accessory protein, partial [Marinilabiliales bacterium]
MFPTLIPLISAETGISVPQVEKTLSLLSEKATIPFIARYRKEVTGSLDEVQIGQIKSVNDKLLKIESRKESILVAIKDQGKLTDEIKAAIQSTFDAAELEDLYLPYKQKRKTKAD